MTRPQFLLVFLNGVFGPFGGIANWGSIASSLSPQFSQARSVCRNGYNPKRNFGETFGEPTLTFALHFLKSRQHADARRVAEFRHLEYSSALATPTAPIFFGGISGSHSESG
jgi:hypothetical protein